MPRRFQCSVVGRPGLELLERSRRAVRDPSKEDSKGERDAHGRRKESQKGTVHLVAEPLHRTCSLEETAIPELGQWDVGSGWRLKMLIARRTAEGGAGTKNRGQASEGTRTSWKGEHGLGLLEEKDRRSIPFVSKKEQLTGEGKGKAKTLAFLSIRRERILHHAAS